MKKLITLLLTLAFAGSVLAASPYWVSNELGVATLNTDLFQVALVFVTNGVQYTNVSYNTTAYGAINDVFPSMLGYVDSDTIIALDTNSKPCVVETSKLLSLSGGGMVATLINPITDGVLLNSNSPNLRKIAGSTTNFLSGYYDSGEDFKVAFWGINANGTLKCVGTSGRIVDVPLIDVLTVTKAGDDVLDANVGISSTLYDDVTNDVNIANLLLISTTNTLVTSYTPLSRFTTFYSSNVVVIGPDDITNQVNYYQGSVTNVNVLGP